MTRISASNAAGGNTFAPNTRPPREILPATVVTALEAYDDLKHRYDVARQRAAELNSDKAMAEADHEDNAAAAAAIAANKPLPEPEAADALMKALEDSTRELRGFETAIGDAENNLRNLTAAEAKKAGYDADKEHEAMLSTVQSNLNRAATAFHAFADREVLNAWMASGAPFNPRTAITVTDVIPMERPRTMDNRTEVPVEELLNGVINALRNGK